MYWFRFDLSTTQPPESNNWREERGGCPCNSSTLTFQLIIIIIITFLLKAQSTRIARATASLMFRRHKF